MKEARLAAIRNLIQEDINHRGLGGDSGPSLISTCPDDFADACQSVAGHKKAGVLIITGFFIPYGKPPAAETDGPLGALFLARALTPLGMKVALASDPFCVPALQAGVSAAHLDRQVAVVTLPRTAQGPGPYFEAIRSKLGWPLTHVVAIERAGPNHTPASLAAQPGYLPRWTEDFVREVPNQLRDRCLTMRGWDVSAHLGPAHLLFEAAGQARAEVTTIGIGDGGNEIGMGKIPWPIIRARIAHGGLIACRVPADYLIVSGISNWGGYGLAAGTLALRGQLPQGLFDPEGERSLLQTLVEAGPLVDGVTGTPAATVDGLAFERYAEILPRLEALLLRG
jgi:D-glutamate cyclase